MRREATRKGYPAPCLTILLLLGYAVVGLLLFHWNMFFIIPTAFDLVQRVFALFVTALAVMPRVPLDKPCTVGGRLSSSFRRLLLVITALYILRKFLRLPRLCLLLLFAVESILFSFLSLLTPYLLRVFLANQINFPGRHLPGKGLSQWMHAVIALSGVATLCLMFFSNENFWALKKIADGLTFFPVVETLNLYNSVTTASTNYPGRGSVLSQVVLVGEYFFVASVVLDVILKILNIADVLDWKDSGKFAKMNQHYAMYGRILCHSILLNTIDESSCFVQPTQSNGEEGQPTQSNDEEEHASLIEISGRRPES